MSANIAEFRLLNAAAKGLNQEIIRLLQKDGGELKRKLNLIKNKEGLSCLHLAAANGFIETVKTLIVFGCSVSDQDLTGYSALQRAAVEGHLEVVEHLVTHGASIDHQDEMHGNAALHEAAWKGFSKTVDFLCKSKANYYLRNKGGFSPLHLCCQNGHNETCRVFLRSGCKPNIKNNYGDTPLHTAARYGHAGVARILHSARCDIDIQNKNGDTPLHIAAAMGRRKLIRILLESGANQEIENHQKEKPRQIAERKQMKEIIYLLNNPPELSIIGKDLHKSKSIIDGNEPGKKSKRRIANWSPYGCHYYPDLSEFPEPNPESIPTTPLSPGEQYYLDLAGNIKKGPASGGYICYCAPYFHRFEKRIDKDKREIVRHLNSCHGKLAHRISHLERKTQDQISNLSNSMKEGFAQERMECKDRMDRRFLRDQLIFDRRQSAHDILLKGDLSSWLERRVTEMKNGVNEDEAVIIARNVITRGSKRRKKTFFSELSSGTPLRRAISEDDILKDEEEGEENGRCGGILRVSDHPHNLMILYDDNEEEKTRNVMSYSTNSESFFSSSESRIYQNYSASISSLPPKRHPPPPYRPPPVQTPVFMPPIEEDGSGRIKLQASNNRPNNKAWPPLPLTSTGTTSEGGDSHNDSGYCTRPGIGSSDPSPSLSGSVGRPESEPAPPSRGASDFLLPKCMSKAPANTIAPRIRELQYQLQRSKIDMGDQFSTPQGSLV